MPGVIAAFIIDKKFVSAAVYRFIGAALGFIGLIHAEQVGWDVGGQIALGDAFAGIILLGFAFVAAGEARADGHAHDDDREAVAAAAADRCGRSDRHAAAGHRVTALPVVRGKPRSGTG